MKTDFVIIGLPASGKTTFLAALWHLIEADETSCRLKLDSYKGDLSYLNTITAAWRSFEKVPRTSQIGDVNVTVQLVDRDSGQKASAHFPDLAGETFDTQIENRKCRPEFLDGLSKDDGILFFISADVKEDALSVVEFNRRMPRDVAIAEGDDAGSNGDLAPNLVVDEELPTTKEWEPKLVPTQVRVVQLLSDLLRAPFAPRRRRLAIVISAWDLARSMAITPRQWLAAHMPLVDQFLRSNGVSFEFEVYGVSAQGVSLDDVAGVGEAARISPSRRIQIAGPDGESHDLRA